MLGACRPPVGAGCNIALFWQQRLATFATILTQYCLNMHNKTVIILEHDSVETQHSMLKVGNIIVCQNYCT